MLTVLLVVIVLLISGIAAIGAVAMMRKGKTAQVHSHKPEVNIHNAAAKGDVGAVQEAISKGADVNAPGQERKRPLHWAAQRGHLEVVAALINARADVNAKDKFGWSSLHLTCGLSNSQNTRERHFQVAKELIANGAAVNATTKEGVTPLYWATKNERKDMVELLLQKDVMINAKDFEGYTAMFWARRGKEPKIVQMLEAQGARE